MIASFFVLLSAPLSVSATPPPAAVHAQAPADASIERGRSLLEQGKPDEALLCFEEAVKRDDSFKTRMWVLRARMSLGDVEDALTAVDEARAAGAKGPDVDYLVGFGLVELAKQAVASGNPGAFVGQQFSDAVVFLERATAADPQRYRDAFLPLAEAAWFAPDLPKARKAIERAVEVFPANVDAQILHGKIAMSQFVAAQQDEAQKAGADAHWNAAVQAFERALAALGSADDLGTRAKRAEAAKELGNAQVWKQAKDKARAAYVTAITAAPATIDYVAAYQALGGDELALALEEAHRKFVAHPDDTWSAPTLVWWLGWIRYDRKQYPEAETAFREAIAKNPQFTNSWFYVYKCCYSQQKYPEAIAALKSFADVDRDGLTNAVLSAKELTQAEIEYLVGWCANPDKHDGKPLNLDAAMLCEVLTRSSPQEGRYWNNLGLFLRDHADILARTKRDTPRDELVPFYERALVAYETALSIAPENPNYLNDTAVILHYNLERELPRALELYAKAYECAKKELERKDLSPDDRAAIQIALRDSKNNLELLKKELEKKQNGEGQ
ncbi:MAG: tetratricopeptide repeat protein [Planctomycetes bacterium]|nr:tetratricopeptide repeat protein [Planctomycetota bacterium]